MPNRINMTIQDRADKLLALREDLYEMHFHQVDRKWLIDAMVDFAQQLPQEISDEEIEKAWTEYRTITNNEDAWTFKEWLKEKLKQRKNGK